MYRLIVLISFIFISGITHAQIKLDRNSKINFFSRTPIEDISADNNEAVSKINIDNGEVEFVMAIKAFKFKIAAMQQHFNEAEYMNSTEFPKASFKGKIHNIANINFNKNGNYNATVTGNLTIKGVTKSISAPIVINVNGAKFTAESKFNIKRKEFNVNGGNAVQKKIAETIAITVKASY